MGWSSSEPMQPTLSGLDITDESARVIPLKRSVPSPDLFRWAQRQSRVIERRTPVSMRGESLILAQALKLGEEVGELYAEVLGRMQLQRSEKQASYNDDSLSGELADVMICASVLAGMLGIDVPQAVARKLEVIEERNRRIEERRA
jgi:NTP pyrophosphatase (non-canonical NTP hydrolase)